MQEANRVVEQNELEILPTTAAPSAIHPLTEQMRELAEKIKQLTQNLPLLSINKTVVTHHKVEMKG